MFEQIYVLIFDFLVFLGNIIHGYLITVFVIHIKNKTVNMTYCKYCKNRIRIFLDCFNVTNLDCNEIKNYIINKYNCVKCIVKLNNKFCELNMFIYFELIYANFKLFLCILEVEKNMLHIKLH